MMTVSHRPSFVRDYRRRRDEKIAADAASEILGDDPYDLGPIGKAGDYAARPPFTRAQLRVIASQAMNRLAGGKPRLIPARLVRGSLGRYYERPGHWSYRRPIATRWMRNLKRWGVKGVEEWMRKVWPEMVKDEGRLNVGKGKHRDWNGDTDWVVRKGEEKYVKVK